MYALIIINFVDFILLQWYALNRLRKSQLNKLIKIKKGEELMTRKKRSGKLKWVVIIIIVLGIIGVVFGGNDDKADSSVASSDNVTTEETETIPDSESKDNSLSDAEIIENDVYNGTGDTVLGKSGCIKASGYDISYAETSDFEKLCSKIEGFKDEYMWFTIDFCDGTGIVFTGCDILMPIYGELDETGAMIKTIGFLTKTDSGYTYEEQSDDTSDASDANPSLTMGQKMPCQKQAITWQSLVFHTMGWSLN